MRALQLAQSGFMRHRLLHNQLSADPGTCLDGPGAARLAQSEFAHHWVCMNPLCANWGSAGERRRVFR
jgi:hypothetical protein